MTEDDDTAPPESRPQDCRGEGAEHVECRLEEDYFFIDNAIEVDQGETGD